MIKDLVAKLYPINRTLVSDGMKEAMDILKQELPDLNIIKYPSNQRVMGWRVPEKWIVEKAYIEDDTGVRYLSYKDDVLHLVSYSTSIDKWMRWGELKSHIHYGVIGTPWEFKYYERDWGFCCHRADSRTEFDWDEDDKFHVVIDAEYIPDEMVVGEYLIWKDIGNGFFQFPHNWLVICTHLDHPYQANDDASGVAVAVEVAKRLQKYPLLGTIGVKFLFVPETIGSIAYYSNHSADNDLAGIFIEAAGNDNRLAVQHSLNWGDIDYIVNDVMSPSKQSNNFVFREGDRIHYEFGELVRNDERVLESVGIPCISLSRFPYPEYHTSADNMSIIHEDKLQEMADVVEKIVRIFCSNYIPIKTYEGLPFLSGYNLWVDWREDAELNKQQEAIFMRFNNKNSVWDISEQVGIEYWKTYNYIEKFRAVGLVKAKMIEKNV